MDTQNYLFIGGWIITSVLALLVAQSVIQSGAPLVAAVWSPDRVNGLTLVSPAKPMKHQLSAPVAQPLARVRFADIQEGSLLVEDATDYLRIPIAGTRVDMQISGMVARVSVHQQFTNPRTDWLNGVYVFPLPDKAAVDYLKLSIGERIIEGQIRERSQAKKLYNKARTEGRKAGLVEQERPNIFTTSVANIGPGETVSIEIQYQQTLAYTNEQFSIRFPMVVAPRYIPGDYAIAGFAGSGWARNTNKVTDAERITPQFTDLHSAGLHNRVSISVDLRTGFPVSHLASEYHSIRQTHPEPDQYLIELDPAQTPANRDFVLSWKPRRGAAPQAALFTQELSPADAQGNNQKETYALLMLLPQRADRSDVSILPREIVYVIDTSGSMNGASINQARQALIYSLSELKEQDRFSLIAFNSQPTSMADHALPVTAGNLSRARHFINALQANGGTEVGLALNLALGQPDSTGNDEISNPLRQIILLTDGSVGNEAELIRLIHEKLGRSRLFTIGIGSAPNSHFMHQAAAMGRGTFTYIGNTSEISYKMTELFQKMKSPVLSDIEFQWSKSTDSSPQIWPNPVPDLYLGEPIIVSLLIPKGELKLQIAGWQAGADWSTTLPIIEGGQAVGLDKLWASAKIKSLTNRQSLSANTLAYKDEITRIALKHHLVSRYTSLVALDVTPTRPVDLNSTDVPIKTLSPANNPVGLAGRIPQTATAAELHLILGLVLLALGCAVLIVQSRRQSA